MDWTCISFSLIVAGVFCLVALIEHRERMAKIQAGLRDDEDD